MSGDLSGETATILEVVAVNAPVATREVADVLDVSHREAELRLRELHADGRVESTSIGRELLWWPAEDWPTGTAESANRNG